MTQWRALSSSERIFLLIVCAVGTWLRFYHIGSESLWRDETFGPYLAGLSIPDFLYSLICEFHPPLYYLLLKLWMCISSSDAWIRSLSALPGILTIPLAYFIGRTLMDRTTASLAAVILALSPFHVWYSREARPYSLSCFFFTLSMWLFVEFLRTESRRPSGTYIAATVFAIWTQFTGFFLPLIHSLSLALKKEQEPPGWKGAQGWIFVLTLPVLIEFAARLLDLRTKLAWIPLQPPAQDIAQLFGSCLSWNMGSIYLPGIIVWVTALAVIPGRSREFRILIGLWFVLPPLIFIISSFVRPLFVVRQLLFCLPAFALLVSGGIASLRKGWAVIGGILMLLCVVIPAVPGLYGIYHDVQRENWRELAREVAVNGLPGDGVLFRSEHSAIAFDHYYTRYTSRQVHHLSLDYEFTEGAIKKMTEHVDRVWMVKGEAKTQQAMEQALQWLRKHYREEKHLSFNGQELYLFSRNPGESKK